jgi:hypothetical protein
MNAEIRRIFASMTPAERSMFRAAGGSLPRDIQPVAPVWREPPQPHEQRGGSGRPAQTTFEVAGLVVYGLHATADQVGCKPGMIEKLRGERVINGVLVRRVSQIIARKPQVKKKIRNAA